MAEALSAYSTKTMGLTGWLSSERAISSEDTEREQRCPKQRHPCSVAARAAHTNVAANRPDKKKDTEVEKKG